MDFLFLLLLAYASGSIPFGALIARSYGVNIQKRGSGNIGFANVQRVLGWRAGIVTLCADILKGFVPVFIALNDVGVWLAFWVGLAAISGHVFSIWLKFHGGKGIATGLGMVIALEPQAALAGASLYAISYYTSKNSSVASLLGIFMVAGVGIALHPATWWMYVLLITTATWTLRHNITGKVPQYDI